MFMFLMLLFHRATIFMTSNIVVGQIDPNCFITILPKNHIMKDSEY